MEVAPRYKLLKLLALLTWLTMLTLLTLLTLFTPFTLLTLFRLLYTGKKLACKPIRKVRTLLEWADELLSKMCERLIVIISQYFSA